MKILKKQSTLLKYSFDPDCLKKNSEINKSQNSSSYWQKGTDNTFILRYDILFNAKNTGSEEYFVNYHNRLELHCLIEDIEVAAREVIKLKDITNLSTQLFLMENTQDYYHLLHFRPMIYTDEEQIEQNHMSRKLAINSEIINIKRVMGILSLEEMSKEERDFVLKKDRG